MSENSEEYICLMNEEEQFSLWISWKDIPLGWKRVGPKGCKEEILEYVTKTWIDMRPKSLRDKMDSV
jgi:MbtH protein